MRASARLRQDLSEFIQKIENLCVIDFTPSNDTPITYIKQRATSYGTLLIDIISKYNTNFFHSLHQHIIVDNTKYELFTKKSFNQES